MKKISWLENAYQGTMVHWSKSQTKIMEMLNQLDIDQIRFTCLADRFILEFMARLNNNAVPRALRIITALKCKKDDPPEKRNKELNIIHRILYNHLKAKFVSVYNGLTEFEAEFMAHLVVTDKSGKTTTMAEMILPQYEKNLADKTVPQFLLGNGN